MTQIPNILKKLGGTSVYDTLLGIESSYARIQKEQSDWYEKCSFTCPEGCGSCCHGFEPDLFEGEVLYMAAWLLENQEEKAKKIADGEYPFHHEDGTCPLYNPDTPYHCSIYGGRPFICRLFGASSFRSRTGEKVWRPCKFYPEEMLKKHNPPLEKKQYSESETIEFLGAVPPLMSDMTENARSSSNGETKLLHEVLGEKIRYLLWLIAMNDNGNDNPNGTPSPKAA